MVAPKVRGNHMRFFQQPVRRVLQFAQDQCDRRVVRWLVMHQSHPVVAGVAGRQGRVSRRRRTGRTAEIDGEVAAYVRCGQYGFEVGGEVRVLDDDFGLEVGGGEFGVQFHLGHTVVEKVHGQRADELALVVAFEVAGVVVFAEHGGLDLPAPGEIERVLRKCEQFSRPVYIELPRDMVGVPCASVPSNSTSEAEKEAVKACAE